MTYFKYVLVGLLTVAVAYLTLCLFTPNRLVISQTIIINAPIDSVFRNVNEIEQWPQWHPWFLDMDTARYSVTAGTKPKIKWLSENEKGGRIEIIGFEKNQNIQTSLTYEKEDYEKVNQGEFLFEVQGNRTLVSWILVGTEYPFLLKPSTIVLKGIFTSNYEKGLKNLKAYSEGVPLPKKRRIDQ